MTIRVQAAEFLATPSLQQEVFGPCAVVVECEDPAQMQTLAEQLAGQLAGQLTVTVMAQNRSCHRPCH
ncbi:hypothetical protein K0I73_07515 [Shewanella mesophila]|uniref:hypothetical protein n=1 Tax=Shewanella mesophila TaxID=2864208 RepID=UPI001C65D8F7|nr:hypothetical protein K0I73_07515 [Shewanella mesophila]